jgi:hypothetical protein
MHPHPHHPHHPHLSARLIGWPLLVVLTILVVLLVTAVDAR